MATRLLGAKLNLLSARDVFNAQDNELSDGGGLLLRCAGANAAWVFRYTSVTGKRREMGLGACARHNARAAGESLVLARSWPRNNAPCSQRCRRSIRLMSGTRPLPPVVRPSEARGREEEGKASLARVARAYHEKLIEPEVPAKLSADWINSLENHVPPVLWHKPIAEITGPELLEFLRDIQDRMADTAQRVRRRLDEVLRRRSRRYVSLNPVAMLRTKLRREHRPPRATFRMSALASVPCRLFWTCCGRPGDRRACLEFTIYTAARTGESIGAKWSEVDGAHMDRPTPNE